MADPADLKMHQVPPAKPAVVPSDSSGASLLLEFAAGAMADDCPVRVEDIDDYLNREALEGSVPEEFRDKGGTG
jgi:hypothetical protein